MALQSLAAEPIIIAHRGFPGVFPDHTLAGFAAAAEAGADFIEPDLVPTRDGHLVARHENEIGATTDVADKFPSRRTTKTIDGVQHTGWFTEDFTLAELKTLWARQPLSFRPTDHDGRHRIPTFEEILDLRAQLTIRLGRTIGVYPETKHPSYFAALGLPLETPLISALNARGLTGSTDPVFLQSFEVGSLKQMAKMTDLPRIQLIGEPDEHPWDLRGDVRYSELLTPPGLAHVAHYAQGIGPHKSAVMATDDDGALRPPTALVDHAHKAGLLVHLYTFRSEAHYLPKGLDPVTEVRRFLAAGVDGVFCDFTPVGVTARLEEARASPAVP
jgi:glycerophosphoryl diester phosphodiesterase